MRNPAYARPKQPDRVRRALLDATSRIAVAEGLGAVTIQAVATAAGVTRGGLFHHFQSKQALVEAMLADLMAQLDRDIDGHMARDDVPFGRFTRAYVDVLLVGETFGAGSSFDALSVAMLSEPSLGRLWATWISERSARHRDTDADPLLEIVRFAADGAWMAHLDRRGDRSDLLALHARLIALTRQESARPATPSSGP